MKLAFVENYLFYFRRRSPFSQRSKSVNPRVKQLLLFFFLCNREGRLLSRIYGIVTAPRYNIALSTIIALIALHSICKSNSVLNAFHIESTSTIRPQQMDGRSRKLTFSSNIIAAHNELMSHIVVVSLQNNRS